MGRNNLSLSGLWMCLFVSFLIRKSTMLQLNGNTSWKLRNNDGVGKPFEELAARLEAKKVYHLFSTRGPRGEERGFLECKPSPGTSIDRSDTLMMKSSGKQREQKTLSISWTFYKLSTWNTQPKT